MHPDPCVNSAAASSRQNQAASRRQNPAASSRQNPPAAAAAAEAELTKGIQLFLRVDGCNSCKLLPKELAASPSLHSTAHAGHALEKQLA
eukprot:1146916-Pelagomonas_calceolata.AAC.4